jgi:hypothetical protein
MTYFLFNKKHLKQYGVYGGLAGLCHALTVWYFLQQSNSGTAAILFIGSIFFMFVIMVYAIRLTKRPPDNNRTWGMLISGQIVVLSGVVVSLIGSIILCSVYRPGAGAIELIFITSTFENYGAGAFISSMIAYVLKPDQTTDRTPEIFEELINDKPFSQEIVEVINPTPGEITTDAGESPDDAIRMKERPLGKGGYGHF